jgi:allophanate hydrolase subunit 1
MTKLEKRFRLLKPPDETALARLTQTHALYGILKLSLAPSLDSLTVEYDATRLRPAEVESALAAAGVDAEPL